MQNVFILGARGYLKSYGGWETLVQGLIDNWEEKSVNFFVFEIVHDKKDERIIELDKVTLIRVFIKSRGSIAMMLYDAKCTNLAQKIVKKHNITNPIFYYLGLRIGPLIYLKRRKFKKLGIALIENAAGLEWKRTKWNGLVRLYTRFAAKLMACSVDYLICDSKEILKEYKRLFPNILAEKRYITYGCYPLIDVSYDKIKIHEFQKENDIIENNYYLIISRFVPENNYELIISQFMKSNTSKKLVLVTNIDKEKKYYDYLIKKLHFYLDKRIQFLGTIYDKDKLHFLRSNAFCYINGHSLGGTNPGLLEAMSASQLVLAFDVVFSREVCEDSAFYFSNNTKESLSYMMDYCEKLTASEIEYYSTMSKKRMIENYSWKTVVKMYRDLFEEIWRG